MQTGRARLRKFVVTEQQTVTVPVTREEVRVVREPIAPGDTVDATIGEAATDVVLTEERVVVDKETVPVEKVRLGTETVTEQQEVTEVRPQGTDRVRRRHHGGHRPPVREEVTEPGATSGPHPRTETLKEGTTMSMGDKIKHAGRGSQVGKVKEATGKATGNESIEAEGKADQAAADVKQAGDKAKDALS